MTTTIDRCNRFYENPTAIVDGKDSQFLDYVRWCVQIGHCAPPMVHVRGRSEQMEPDGFLCNVGRIRFWSGDTISSLDDEGWGSSDWTDTLASAFSAKVKIRPNIEVFVEVGDHPGEIEAAINTRRTLKAAAMTGVVVRLSATSPVVIQALQQAISCGLVDPAMIRIHSPRGDRGFDSEGYFTTTEGRGREDDCLSGYPITPEQWFRSSYYF